MFISDVQAELLAQRIIVGVPSKNTEDAKKIAKIICEWFSSDVLPQLMVNPGIPLTAGVYPGATTGPGTIQ